MTNSYRVGTSSGDIITVECSCYADALWLSVFMDGEWKFDLPCVDVEHFITTLRKAKKGG